MNQAIEQLMMEHRLIEQVLGSIETFATQLEMGAEADRQTVEEYADFFKNFADRCHHGKEEDRLFTRMTEFGFPREYGPIAVMLADHMEGREHVGALRRIGAGVDSLTEPEREEIVHHTNAYVALLRAHIVKEDNILYPMAVQTIPGDAMEQLAKDFDAFEAKEMGEGTHERFHRLAESLIAAYPPDSAKMAAGSACMGCAGHM